MLDNDPYDDDLDRPHHTQRQIIALKQTQLAQYHDETQHYGLDYYEGNLYRVGIDW